jgi:hypothetical protein
VILSRIGRDELTAAGRGQAWKDAQPKRRSLHVRAVEGNGQLGLARELERAVLEPHALLHRAAREPVLAIKEER